MIQYQKCLQPEERDRHLRADCEAVLGITNAYNGTQLIVYVITSLPDGTSFVWIPDHQAFDTMTIRIEKADDTE